MGCQAMAKRAAKKSTRRKATAKKPIESYDHTDKKRANNDTMTIVDVNVGRNR